MDLNLLPVTRRRDDLDRPLTANKSREVGLAGRWRARPVPVRDAEVVCAALVAGARAFREAGCDALDVLIEDLLGCVLVMGGSE